MAKIDQTVSIDIRELSELSTSLTKKCKNLYPLSRDRCISRVPRQVRGCKSKDHYTPEVVSIGPLHHGKEELKDMEEHKMRYLHYFLKRTQVRIEDFLKLIKDKEMKFRTFYSDVIEKNKYDLSMILLDAVFLIEYFWRGYEHAESRSRITDDEDLLFGEPRIEVIWDLLLVENQIPLFILSDLFDLAKTAMSCDHHEGLSMIKITSWFRNKIADYFPVQPNLLEINFSEARHILDMLSLCFRPTTPKNIEDKEQNMPSLCFRSTIPKNIEDKEQNIPSIKQLHQAGMIFKAPSDKNLLDITFKDGILEIPFLNIYDNTERIYRNIIAFEHMHASTRYFNDYVLLMSFLVTTAKDAELLIQNKVIGRRYRQTLSTVFSSLNKTCNWSDDEFQYSGLVEALNVYCESRRHKWKAILKEKYFNTPWSFLSVSAAVILLLLTVVQTICSIIAL